MIKVGWIISNAGCFGSVREMIEISNVLEKHDIKTIIFTDDGKNYNWLPSNSQYELLSNLNNYNIDYLILMTSPDDLYFKIWNEYHKCKLKSICIMGYNPEDVTREKFITDRLTWIVKNHWPICDGSWQLNDLKRFNPSANMAIGGINLSMFKPAEGIEKIYDVIYSGDPRARKGTKQVIESIEGFSSISYFYKRIPQNELPSFISQGKIFVDGHKIGGWCNPVAEAMACGLVPVCTDIPCNSDFAIHGETALKVKIDDINGMKLAIRAILNNQGLYEKLRTNGLQKIKEFDYEIIGKRFADEIKFKLYGTIR